MSEGISSRQQSILDYVREHGTVHVDPLARVFEVTPQTIRRDLNILYEQELLQRTHGGAVVRDHEQNLGYGARKNLMAPEKEAIGRRVAELVPDGASLYINIGTTTEEVAGHLSTHSGLLVITNNIHVANQLWPQKSTRVMIASGSIRREDGGIVGPSTEEFIDRFKVDFAVIGCSAIDLDGEVFDYDLREVRVAQAIVRRSRSVILVADSTKFERTAPISICDFDGIDFLVTDRAAPAELVGLCNEKGVSLELVENRAAVLDRPVPKQA